MASSLVSLEAAGSPEKPGSSVIQLLGVVLVPVRNLDDDVGRSVGHGLATEARLRGDAGRFVQLIELSVSGFIAGFQAFSHDDVTRRAGADAAASMVQTGPEAL